MLSCVIAAIYRGLQRLLSIMCLPTHKMQDRKQLANTIIQTIDEYSCLFVSMESKCRVGGQ